MDDAGCGDVPVHARQAGLHVVGDHGHGRNALRDAFPLDALEAICGHNDCGLIATVLENVRMPRDVFQRLHAVDPDNPDLPLDVDLGSIEQTCRLVGDQRYPNARQTRETALRLDIGCKRLGQRIIRTTTAIIAKSDLAP